MMMIDPANYPSIRWRWRIFVGCHFLMHLHATLDEVLATQSVIFSAIDREHLTVDLI